MLARRSVSALSHIFSARCSSSFITPSSRDKWRLSGQKAPRSILEDADDTTPIDLSEDNDAVNGSRPGTPPVHLRTPSGEPTPTEHINHRRTIAEAFPEGWSPPRKLSREAMEGLRQLYHYDKTTFTTPLLAERFRISPEAVRRILKSKWEPPKEKREKMLRRQQAHRAELSALRRAREQTEAKQLEQIRQEQQRQRKRASSNDTLLFE